MPYDSLREFLDKLESEGELKRVKREVHWNLELSHIARLSESRRGPALLFESVKDHPGKRVVVNVLDSKERLALALEVDPHSRLLDLAKHWLTRVDSRRVPPEWVDSSADRDNISIGTDVDLYELPAPWFYPGDGGRYLGTAGCLITRNLHTGRINVGTYRGMIADKDKMTQVFMPSRDAEADLQAYADIGKPMPVAWVAGIIPEIFLCSSFVFPSGVSEYDLAGALRDKPIKVTKGKIVDLPIPVEAEIVLEGEIVPGKRLPEGPFGEFTGYYSGKKTSEPREYIEVKAMSYRDNPILWASTAGSPVSDTHMMGSLCYTASLWSELQKTGIPGIKSVYCPPAGGGRMMAIVSLEQMYSGHPTQVGLAAFASVTGSNHGLKTVLVVDADIDPENIDQVLYAMSFRCQPERSVQIPGRSRLSLLEPPLPAEARLMTSRMLIDACLPYEWAEKPAPVVLDRETTGKIESQWDQYFTD